MSTSRRSLLLGLGALASTAALAACDQGTDSDANGNADYVEGDGSWNEYPPDERSEPVELAGESMTGEPIDLADWRDGPVVLNFWYAACPPCRKEAPDLAALATELEPDGVRFLGVNHTDEPATANAFERRFDIPYPTLHDSDASGVAAMQGLVPLQAMPSTVVLDAQGRVAARIIGLADPSTLRSMIETVLAET